MTLEDEAEGARLLSEFWKLMEKVGLTEELWQRFCAVMPDASRTVRYSTTSSDVLVAGAGKILTYLGLWLVNFASAVAPHVRKGHESCGDLGCEACVVDHQLGNLKVALHPVLCAFVGATWEAAERQVEERVVELVEERLNARAEESDCREQTGSA